MMPGRTAAPALLLAALSALACARPASGPLLEAGARALPSPAPARCRYGEEPTHEPSPLEEGLLDVARARLGTGRSVPVASSALARAARELAASAADGEADPVSRRRLRDALARTCAFDPAPAAALIRAPPEDLPAALSGALPRETASHVGLAAVVRDGVATAVLLASDRHASLSPFPRDVSPSESADLSGSLDRRLRRPRVFVTRPTGRVDEIETAGMRGFRASIPFRQPGRHVVEVTAEGEGGPEVAALLVVSAGGAPIEEPRSARVPAPEAGAAPGEAEAAVLRAIQSMRRRHGLPPLEPDAAIAAAARRHSEAMAAAGRVAHVLRGSPDAGERLARAGVPYRRVHENVSRASDALEAHEATEESPAHLANVLTAGATRVGVGIAAGRLPGGPPAVYLTEIFVEEPDDGSSSRLTPAARVREAIWRERARLRLHPLVSDPALDAVAEEAARQMRDRDAPEAPDLSDRALALGRKVAAVDVFVASAPGDATRSANLPDRRWERVGVGVAQGASRRFGAGRWFIAVVYTD